jgi:hypothetical protein
VYRLATATIPLPGRAAMSWSPYFPSNTGIPDFSEIADVSQFSGATVVPAGKAHAVASKWQRPPVAPGSRHR